MISQGARLSFLAMLRNVSRACTTPLAENSFAMLPARRIRAAIVRSGLFDARYYLDQCGNHTDAMGDPLEHYLSFGEAQGLRPNPLFDPTWYRANCMGAQARASSALAHYVLIGARGERAPGPDFDAAAYRAVNPDVAFSGAEPLRHFLLHGAMEGRLGANGMPNNAGWFGVVEQHKLSPEGADGYAGDRPALVAFEKFRLASGSARPATLHVLHKAGGGTERAVAERIAAHPDGERHLVLMADRTEDGLSLALLTFDPSLLRFDLELAGASAILRLLKPLGIGHLIVHQPLGLMDELPNLLVMLGVTYDVVMHDYSLLCPRSSFVTATGRYCGEPDSAGCSACLKSTPAAAVRDIEPWRSQGVAILEGAARVECALEDVAARVKRYAPRARTVVVPMSPVDHRRLHKLPEIGKGPLKVAVIGHCSTAKGGDFLLDCIEAAQAIRAPISWSLIGSFAGADLARARQLKHAVRVTGAYAPDKLGELLQKADPDLLLFPQRCVETWSYALSEAIESGRTILAPNLGAFGERLHGVVGAYHYPETEAAVDVVRRILRLRQGEAAGAGILDQTLEIGTAADQ